MVSASIYGYFTKTKIELISLYLSIISIIGSFHISFTIGILLNSKPGNINIENKPLMGIFLTTIGVLIISAFVLGYLYRNYLYSIPQFRSTVLSLQKNALKLIIN